MTGYLTHIYESVCRFPCTEVLLLSGLRLLLIVVVVDYVYIFDVLHLRLAVLLDYLLQLRLQILVVWCFVKSHSYNVLQHLKDL